MMEDWQVAQVREDIHNGITLTASARRVGVDRRTAKKYIDAGKLPSQMKKPIWWRTRCDPFAEHRDQIDGWITNEPELTPRDAMERLIAAEPARYRASQIRTMERRFLEQRR